MVITLAPLAIFVGVSATVVFAFFSFWGSVNERATAKVRGLASQLDRAGIRMGSQEIVLTVAGGVALVWIGLVLLMRPGLLISLLLLPIFVAGGAFFFHGFLQFRIRQRLEAFVGQLETAMRLIAGGIRAGLGLRQALAIVIDEMPDPSRYEFRRVMGQTNIGVSILDAIDDLAARMPSNETLMVARVFRVQSQTGGDLARILDQLADTIKARRQVHRKVGTLTAEGRMSALVLLLIPIGLALFVLATQAEMAHALLYTTIGHLVLLAVAVLELLGFAWVKSLLRVDV
jgi:tight adherence protein B